MSPNRFQANTKLWVYRFLVLRDGEQCARCFEKPTAKNGNISSGLDIHHLDGNHFNNEPDNLALYCRACNNKARSNGYSATCVSVCEIERKEGKASTRVTREALDYRAPETPTTMQANFLYELDFRQWLLQAIQEKGFLSKQDAIAAGAEVVGCSPSTTERYLRKLTSSVGVLNEVRDMLGETVLTWKPGVKPEDTIKIDLDKLMERHARPGFQPDLASAESRTDVLL